MSHVSGSLSGGGEALNGSGLEAGSVLQTPYMNPTIAALNGGNRVGGGGGDGGETMSNSTLGNSNSNSNSESSPTSRKAYENEYDTPPDNIVEAVSPTSSRKRGLLRAGSLGYSPTAARARRQATPNPTFRSVSSTQGTRPVLTLRSKSDVAQAENMPPQGTNSSGQGDLGHGQALSDRTYAGTVQFTRDSHQATTVRPSNAQNLGFDNPYHLAPNRLFGVFSKDPRDVNPYAHRADEIGPTHRIPGIGHLGNLLVPPGWNQGDEPITPLQAQDLYNKARKEAQNILNKTKGDVERLPKDEQERRNEERDWEWNIHFKLDDLLLRERIMMYDQYHERRHIKFQQAKLKVQPQAYSLYPLHTLQPQAVTSIPYYGEPHGPGMLSHQVSFDPPNFQSNDQILTSYADPKSLDPSLLNQSIPAVFNRFRNTQMEAFRKKVESDQQYGSFLAQYSDPSQGSLAPNSPAPLTGPQAAPFASIHTGYDAQPSTSPINVLPRPLPYVSPTQARFGPWKHTLPRISQLDRPSDAGPARSFSGGPEASRYPVISVSQDNAGYPLTNIENDPTGLAGNQAFQTQSEQGYLTLGSNAEVIKPKKKRASRAKPAELKEKAWYYQDVQEANLPTSSISAEAEQAGEQFENEQSKIMKVKKPAAPKTTRVKRGRKPAFDPVKGFPISAKAAAQLVNGGFLRKELPAAAAHAHAHGMASSNSSMMSYGAPIAADRPGLYLNQPVQPPYPTPGSQVNFVYSHQAPLIPTSATAENDASSPPNAEPSHAAMDGDPVELSDSSSDAPDDPKDKSFGTPSRRKSTPATQSATRGAKRKIASTAPKTKRSRLSTDGAHDEEEDETSCAGGSPAG